MGRPYVRSICSIFPLCMESNALEKSTNKKDASRFFFHILLQWFNELSNSERVTDLYDIVAGPHGNYEIILQGDTLAPFQFIICWDYLPQTTTDLIKENGFILKKAKSKQYQTETISDIDYRDDLALLANTPAQAKSQLHSLEQTVRGIGLYITQIKQSSCVL